MTTNEMKQIHDEFIVEVQKLIQTFPPAKAFPENEKYQTDNDKHQVKIQELQDRMINAIQELEQSITLKKQQIQEANQHIQSLQQQLEPKEQLYKSLETQEKSAIQLYHDSKDTYFIQMIRNILMFLGVSGFIYLHIQAYRN
jgi:uncharacterized UPF0160 family protein